MERIWANHHKKLVGTAMLIAIPLAVFVCVYKMTEGEWALPAVGIAALVLCVIVPAIKNVAGEAIYDRLLMPVYQTLCVRNWHITKWVIAGVIIVFIVVIVLIDAVREPERLISFVGLFFFIGLCWLCSKHRSKVNWRPVVWGFMLQFFLGLIIMRTDWGFSLFEWLGTQMNAFLAHSDAGAEFVFGPAKISNHMFAFKVLPTSTFVQRHATPVRVAPYT
jgi:pyrimidine nucleoside transport protein